MYQIVYASTAACSFSSAQLVDLLEKSRKNNAKLGVTGMLLYQRGKFVQVLEGEERVVRDLADRIAKDPRHTGVVILHEGPSSGREFPDWSMGFRDLDDTIERGIEGYSRLLDSSLSPASFARDAPAAKRILLEFKAA